MISNPEIEYLNELIKEFPEDQHPSAFEAYHIIKTRYDELEKNIPVYINILNDPPKKIFRKPLTDWIIDEDHFPMLFYLFCKLFHRFLFEGILKNSGQFRKSTDPENGRIGFGGLHPRKVASTKYYGVAPNRIVKELRTTFSLLKKNSSNPLKTGLEFYRKFVRIHPFYDANGRIARLLLSIYLLTHGRYINWRAIETGGNKTKFIHKLNACHNNEGQLKYDEYFKYLYNFIIKFVVDIKDFEIQ